MNVSNPIQRAARGLMIVLAATLSPGGAALADDAATPPDELVKRVVSDVMQSIKSDPEIQAGSIPKINALVDAKVLPYVDFRYMTASAVGRNWGSATPEQQEKIVGQFRQLLTYTYSGALSQVRDQTIQFKPYRASPSDTVVQVNTEVISTHGGDPIDLNYKLKKQADGWKIIDVNIIGVWLVQNYRNEFGQLVTAGGIDGLIKGLSDKNAALAAKPATSGKN